jgi:hypothetical protein
MCLNEYVEGLVLFGDSGSFDCGLFSVVLSVASWTLYEKNAYESAFDPKMLLNLNL